MRMRSFVTEHENGRHTSVSADFDAGLHDINRQEAQYNSKQTSKASNTRAGLEQRQAAIYLKLVVSCNRWISPQEVGARWAGSVLGPTCVANTNFTNPIGNMFERKLMEWWKDGKWLPKCSASQLLSFQHVPPTAPTFQPKDFLDTSGADTLPSYRAPPDLQGIHKCMQIANLQSADWFPTAKAKGKRQCDDARLTFTSSREVVLASQLPFGDREVFTPLPSTMLRHKSLEQWNSSQSADKLEELNW